MLLLTGEPNGNDNQLKLPVVVQFQIRPVLSVIPLLSLWASVSQESLADAEFELVAHVYKIDIDRVRKRYPPAS